MVQYSKEVWSFKCLESGCNTSFQQGPFLVNNLEKYQLLPTVNIQSLSTSGQRTQ
jgi:hypothetical protein